MLFSKAQNTNLMDGLDYLISLRFILFDTLPGTLYCATLFTTAEEVWYDVFFVLTFAILTGQK